ncbi:MAG: hypothetical protein ACLTK0_02735 [Anaerovoracaceae bacterium]
MRGICIDDGSVWQKRYRQADRAAKSYGVKGLYDRVNDGEFSHQSINFSARTAGGHSPPAKTEI